MRCAPYGKGLLWPRRQFVRILRLNARSVESVITLRKRIDETILADWNYVSSAHVAAVTNCTAKRGKLRVARSVSGLV